MKNYNKNDISFVIPLLTLTIFSLCILLVLLFGAKLYKNALDQDRSDFDKRTANQYLLTRIRQSDAEGRVFIGSFASGQPSQEGDTFYLVEELGGELYYTRIYCHEGYLYELFTAAEDTFDKADGEKILPLDGLSFQIVADRLQIHVEHTDCSTTDLTASLRSMEGIPYAK
jgi:hypothetical protein